MKSVTSIRNHVFDDVSNEKKKTFTIKCYPGSYAQKWARENGYTIKNAEED